MQQQTGRETVVIERVIETSVLLAPTFVDRDIRVMLSVGEHKDEDKEPDFVFDTTTPSGWDLVGETFVLD